MTTPPTSARSEMLATIRRAVAGTVAIPDPHAYVRVGEFPPGSTEAVALMVDRLVDYRARVQVVGLEALESAVASALSDAAGLVVPPGLPETILRAVTATGIPVVTDGQPDVLTAAQLDGIDAVVTTARIGIALSGTIVLDGSSGQGRRALTLVPDTHLVVLTADQIVHTVPEALAQLSPTAPLTMIAGPSATSDIELSRVEGVHGPRNLQVVILTA